ncbi:MAG: portal protein, partial [Candidatus Nanopelagicaceae bacterium]
RKRFSELFHDILKTQLILKGVISPEDWDDMKEHIQYDYLFDNHFNELKEIEMMNQRMLTVTQMDAFVGKYFSVEYIRRNILGQKDKQFDEIDKQIKGEIASGLAIDPAQTNMMDTMAQQNTAFQPELQDIQAQDSAERESEAADANMDREIKKAKAMPKPSASNK